MSRALQRHKTCWADVTKYAFHQINEPGTNNISSQQADEHKCLASKYYSLIIKQLPVGFALYSLPPLPEHDGLLLVLLLLLQPHPIPPVRHQDLRFLGHNPLDLRMKHNCFNFKVKTRRTCKTVRARRRRLVSLLRACFEAKE